MTEPLIASFEEVWGDIVEVCADLTDAQWEKPTDCPGWTVKDNVAHMIGTERMLLGEQRTHAFANQLLRAFLNMQTDLFRKIVVESAATKDTWNPIHGELLLAGWGFGRIED